MSKVINHISLMALLAVGAVPLTNNDDRVILGNFNLPTVSGPGTISAVVVGNGGVFTSLPALATSGDGTGDTFAATMAASSAVPVAAGTGYAPTNTITLTGGTETTNAILTVATTKLVSAALNAGGANYAVGDQVVLAGGTAGTPAVLQVTGVNAGAITTFIIVNPGSYTANSATFTQASTTGSGTGATFQTGVFGVNTVTVTTAGSYTALPANAVAQGATSGSGTGATFTVLWKILSVAVTGSGATYDSSTTLGVASGSQASIVTPPTLTLTLSQTAGASVVTNLTGDFPANYSVQVTCDQDAVAYVSSKTTGGFTLTMNPRLAANALAAGNASILILG